MEKLIFYYQQQLQEIQQQCQQVTEKIKKGLLEGSAVSISNREIMNCYNNIYHLVDFVNIKKMNGIEVQLIMLYTGFLKEFINDIYKQVNEFQWEKESILQIVSKSYHDYKSYSKCLYKMFYYLDKFVMPYQGTTLCKTSLKLFKEGYFDKYNKIILNTILQFIQESRKNGILINKQIKNLIQLFSDMSLEEVQLKYMKEVGEYNYICEDPNIAYKLYENQFQTQLLQETSKFYKNEIDAKQNFTTTEYINWANSIFKLELNMCVECYPKSYLAIESKLKQILIKEQVIRLINSFTGLGYMLQYDQIDELKLLFQFIFRIKECIFHIVKYFELNKEFINNSFDQELKQQNECRQQHEAEIYFIKILELMEKVQNIFQNQLEEQSELFKSYCESFSLLINQHEKSPIWLAIYIDIILRRQKRVNEIEIDKRLSNILFLFQLLHQRDVFFKHYQKLLSNRLLNLQNIQLEKQILQRFKGEIGSHFLTQLYTMISDIELSNRFSNDQQIHNNTKLNLNAVFLTTECWPITNIQDQIIKPLQMQNILDDYEKLYSAQNKGRILIWCFNLGQGELTYKIQTEKYYLNVNTMQMVAFLQFNQGDSFSIKNILDMTNISKRELENSLIPFICMKIISREKQDIENFSDENEVLKLNLYFINKVKKIKLLPNSRMQPKRSKEEIENEDQQQMEQINKQRELVVDSQLIRLMKSKKTIKHNELVQNCQSMISIFKPDQQLIKQRIESLIYKEYIIRDEDEWDIYHYLN